VSRIAVVGAGGYVGRILCTHLASHGHEVVGVARSNGALLLAKTGAIAIEPRDVASIGDVDVVANLAYPSGGSPLLDPARNKDIGKLVQTLARTRGRVIHVSTQAVFGLHLDREPVAGPCKRARDFPYVEAKIELEHWLRRRFGAKLVVIRLGNVWGPGSPNWTAGLADRLMFGQPVGVVGADGWSNLTDVGNAVALIAYCIDRDDIGGDFFHLAEFSDRRWSPIVDAFAAELDVEPVRVHAPVPSSWSVGKELRAAWGICGPPGLGRWLLSQRYAGSVLRGVMRRLPAAVLAQMRGSRGASGPRPTVSEDAFLQILACERRFESILPSAWRPSRSWTDSWLAVRDWLLRAGYGVGGGVRG